MGIFKPMWMSGNIGIACNAVAKVSDDSVLRRIVQEARLDQVWLAAARKLSDKGMGDESYWRELASTHCDREVRILAASSIDDMAFLEDFLGRPENYGRDGSPDPELSQKLDKMLNKKKLDTAEEYIREIDIMDDCALLAQIASMDDAAVEERFGKSELANSVLLPSVREHALTRLIAIKTDKAYRMLTQEGVVSRNVALHVVSSIEDDQLLYRIASNSNAQGVVRVKAIGSTWMTKRENCYGIADIDLLGKLANLPLKKFNYNLKVLKNDDEVRETAARKLRNLPCRNGQYHDWQCVEENIREVGEHYYGTRRYRCSTCGNEYVENVSERS